MAKLSDAYNQIRTIRFLPEDIEFKVSSPKDLYLDLKASLTMSMLITRVRDKNLSVHGFDWNALKVSTYGTGFMAYEVASGSAPAAFADTDELESSDGYFHRFDITIAVQTAEIRFYQELEQSWGDAIPLSIGTSSIEFSSSKIQVKDGGVAGTTYTIVGYR